MRSRKLHIVLFIILLGLILLFLLGLLLLRVPAIQSYAGKQVKNYIAHRIDTPFEIGEIEINIYDQILLKDVYLEDEKGDTLIAAKELFIDLDAVSLLNQQLTAEAIRLDGGVVKIVRTSEGTNLDFILEQFASGTKEDSKTESAWDINFGDLEVAETRLEFTDQVTGELLNAEIGEFTLNARETDLKEKVAKLKTGVLRNAKVVYVQGVDPPGTEEEEPAPFKLKDIAWVVGLDNLSIEETSFAFKKNSSVASTPRRMNFQDLAFTKIGLEFSDLQLEGESLSFVMDNIQAREKSGLELKSMRSKVQVTDKNIELEDLLLETKNSTVQNFAKFKFRNLEDLRDFQNKVIFDVDLEKSQLSLEDLKFFLPRDAINRIDGVVGTQEKIRINGNLRGRVSNFRASDLELMIGDHTYYSGSAKWSGLPDVQNTFIDFRFDELRTSTHDLQDLLSDIEMPIEFMRLGPVNMKGSFTGFLKDFVADVELNTALGNVVGDINLKARGPIPSYTGNFALNQFELGKFLGREKEFGSVTLDTRVEGKGFELDELDAFFNGVGQVEYKGHNYQGIKLDGRFVQRLFKGNLDVDDESLQMDFTGTVDLNKEQPVFSFSSDIRDANLKNLNFVKDDLRISTNAELALSGNNIDNVKGTASFKNVTISRDDEEYVIDEVELYSVIDQNRERILRLNSELFEAEFIGDYDFKGLSAAVREFINNYFPLEFEDAQAAEEQDIDFKIEIQEPLEFVDLLVPKLEMVSPGVLEGHFNNERRQLDLHFELDSLIYDRFRIDSFALQANSDAERIHLTSNIAELSIDNKLSLPDVALVGDIKDYRLDFGLTVSEDDPDNGIDIVGALESNFKSVNLVLEQMDIRTRGVLWQGDLEEAYFKARDDFYINKFVLAHSDQSLLVNSVNEQDVNGPVEIVMNDFKLDEFASIASKDHLKIKGVSNGVVSIDQLFINPVLTGDIEVADFEFLGKPVGDIEVHSNKQPGKQEIKIDGVITENGNDANFNGTYYIDGETERLIHGVQSNVDLDVDVNAFQIEWLEALMGAIIRDTEGQASGQVQLYGDIKQPSLKGELALSEAKARVIFLNNVLGFDKQVIRFDNKKVLFEDMQVTDKYNDKASVNGYLALNDYKTPSLDVRMETDQFLFLDTKRGDSSLFYGTALGSGSARFSGPLNKLQIDIRAKSHKGTSVSLPLGEDSEDLGHQHVFTFIEKDDAKAKAEKEKEPEVTRDLAVNIDLEVTPDANLYMIFDEAAGDIISATGNGDLSIAYHSKGLFQVDGIYVVDEGKYAFAKQDVVNKDFVVKPGGFVQFFGSPYDAIVDIEAAYSVAASLSDLVGGGGGIDDQATSERVPIDVIMDITGTLAQPNIDFRLEINDNTSLGSITSDAQTELDRINNDQDKNELNRQAFNLLVFQKFIPSNQGTGDGLIGTSVNATLSEFVSNQLSNLLNETLSQFIPNSDFDLNWSKYSAESSNLTDLSRNEVELIYTQRLFNDRVSINVGGNVDVGEADDSQTSNVAVAGDFIFQYMITKDGKYRLKVYGKMDEDSFTGYRNDVAGIALFVSEEFDDFEGLKRNFKSRKVQRQMRKLERANLKKVEPVLDNNS